MKINIVIESESIGLQTIDWFYAYSQSKNHNYKSDILIAFSDNVLNDHCNVLYSYQNIKNKSKIDLFDLVLVDNAGESIEVCNPETKFYIEQHPNVYFLCGSFVDNTHYLKNKIIPYNHCLHLFRRCYTDGFYPQYYTQTLETNSKTKNFLFINGENRSHRHFFAELLREHCTFVDHFRAPTTIQKTIDSQFEDTNDQIFRDFVNDKYQNSIINKPFNHLVSGIDCGIDKKFGHILPGYFLLPEYSEYKCAIFPESCWTNHQFFMTEKVFKCFVTECLPMPIAGANTAKLYNKYGFHTVFDLCPAKLRNFDACEDHVERYHGVIECLHWLNENIEILDSDRATKLTKHNKNHFYSSRINTESSLKYEKIFGIHQ